MEQVSIDDSSYINAIVLKFENSLKDLIKDNRIIDLSKEVELFKNFVSSLLKIGKFKVSFEIIADLVFISLKKDNLSLYISYVLDPNEENDELLLSAFFKKEKLPSHAFDASIENFDEIIEYVNKLLQEYN